MKHKDNNEDYYFDENGLLVMTEAYHRKRGFCCGNKCRHCPYNYENVPKYRKKGWFRRK